MSADSPSYDRHGDRPLPPDGRHGDRPLPPDGRHGDRPLPRLRETVRGLWRAPRRARAAIAAIFVAALLLRLVLVSLVTPAFVSDARDYRVLARNLAEGRGYLQVYEGETEAFHGFTFRAFRPPGYPAVLALLHTLCGWNSYAYLFANVAADLVTQICFLLIATRLLGLGPAILVLALLGLHVLWTPNPMSESVHTALFAVLAMLLVFGLPLRGWRGALGFGLVAAAALFVRPISVCVFPALGWKFLRQARTRRGAALVLISLLPSVAGVSAWGLRNYRLFGQVVLFTTNFGHHNAYDYGLPADWLFAKLRAQGLNEAQIDRQFVRLQWEKARAYPRAWLITIAQRAVALFSLEPAWEVRHVLWKLLFWPDPDASLAGRIYRASYAQYYVTYAAAACGTAVLLLRRRPLDGLWSLLLAYVLIHALVSRGDMRLAAPLYPVLCLLAATFAAAACEHLRGAARPRSGTGRMPVFPFHGR